MTFEKITSLIFLDLLDLFFGLYFLLKIKPCLIQVKAMKWASFEEPEIAKKTQEDRRKNREKQEKESEKKNTIRHKGIGKEYGRPL